MLDSTRGRRPIRRAATPLLWLAALLWLGGCASRPPVGAEPGRSAARGAVQASGDRDGADAHPPADLVLVPDAEPRVEPVRSGGANKPYQALGRDYVPITVDQPFVERGLASWYGRKFQGRRTSSGEPYDMYAMTAAHPTLPIPSYARIRNPANGREVVVRINDRGPFHSGRIVDLSYTAALKLDVLRGVAPVELERITFDDIRSGGWRKDGRGDAVQTARNEIAAQAGSRVDGSSAASGAGALASIPATVTASLVASAQAPASATASATAPAPAPDAATASDPVLATSRAMATAVRAPPSSASVLAPITVAGLPIAAADSGASVSTARGRVGESTTSNGPASTTAAALAAPETPEARLSSPASPAAGFWVQLGAFRERGGAEGFQRRLVADADWLGPLLAVFDERAIFRLQAGPYPTRDDAVHAADRIRDAMRLVPMIVERR